MSARHDAGDWFALSRVILSEALAEPDPDPAEDPAAGQAPARKGWFGFLRRRTVRRAPPARVEPPASRANRVALAAAARDWDALDAGDRDLLRRALAGEPDFAALALALGSAPAPSAGAAGGRGDGPTDAFVFDPLPSGRSSPAPQGEATAPEVRDVPPPSRRVPRAVPAPLPPSARPRAATSPVPVPGDVVRVGGVSIPVLDVLSAPVLATLRGECGGAVALREHEGTLLRPLTRDGGLEPVAIDGFDASSSDGLVVVDGKVHRPTAPPTLHVACVRSVRPLGRDGGWLQPKPSDGYRLAWRFPDGPDSLGWGGGQRRDKVVTWDLAADPGPDIGMVGPSDECHVLALGLAHASTALRFYMAATEAIGPGRPDLAWQETDVPDVPHGHDSLSSPTPDEALAALGDDARSLAVAEALSSALDRPGKGLSP